MKKRDLLLILVLFYSMAGNAQTELRILPSTISGIGPINDFGVGASSDAFYDYATNQVTFLNDTNVISLRGIDNDGNLAALIRHPNSTPGYEVEQPGFKPAGGQWIGTGVADDYELTWQSVSYVYLSRNGLYLTGVLPEAYINSNEGYAYRFNTTTQELENIKDYSICTSSRGFGISDGGTVAGLLTPIGNSNVAKRPIYIPLDNSTHYVFDAYTSYAAYDITSEGNVNVGMTYDGEKSVPYINYMDEDYSVVFSVPDTAISGALTRVSNNGIAIGYHKYDNFYLINNCHIYHPALGDSLILIQDLLQAYGIELPSNFYGRMGRTGGISPNGEYIVGRTDSGVSWVIKLDLETLGIPTVGQSNEHNASFSVFPNPSNGRQLRLEFDHHHNQKLQGKLVDTEGRLLANFEVQAHPGKNSVNLASYLPTGYKGALLVNLDFGNRLVSKMVVVE